MTIESSNPDVQVNQENQARSGRITVAIDTDNTPVEITVTALLDEDGIADTAVISHTVTGEDLVSRTLPISVTDINERGVTVDPTSLEIPEGGSLTYRMVLDTKPTDMVDTTDPDTVTVTITGASGDVTVRPSQVTFTSGNWSQAQTVEVSAEEDADGEQDATVTLRHTVRGADYDGESVGNVTVTIEENESRGIVVNKSTLDLMEGGESGTYTVALSSQPTGTVTVRVRGISGDVTVKPSQLTFTTSTWNNPRTVTVSASEDADAEEDAAVTLTHAASGGGYNGVAGGAITVTIMEDDTGNGLTVTPSLLTVPEGSEDSYTVVLNAEPTGAVTVTWSIETPPDAV